MTSLLDAVPALRFGVATLPATLLRLLSAMANQGSSFVLPGAHAKDLTPKTHTSSGYAIQRNERNEKARAHAQPSSSEARACGELLKLGADTMCCGVGGGKLSALTSPRLAPARLLVHQSRRVRPTARIPSIFVLIDRPR